MIVAVEVWLATVVAGIIPVMTMTICAVNLWPPGMHDTTLPMLEWALMHQTMLLSKLVQSVMEMVVVKPVLMTKVSLNRLWTFDDDTVRCGLRNHPRRDESPLRRQGQLWQSFSGLETETNY